MNDERTFCDDLAYIACPLEHYPALILLDMATIPFYPFRTWKSHKIRWFYQNLKFCFACFQKPRPEVGRNKGLNLDFFFNKAPNINGLDDRS